MFVARAFIFGVSARAVLAVLAVALSTAYALTAGGALSGLQGAGATYEEAATDRGWALYKAGFAAFEAAEAPGARASVDWENVGGVRIATVRPWPMEAGAPVVGRHAPIGPTHALWADLDLANATRSDVPYAPIDAVVLPPQNFSALYPDREGLTRWAFVPGDDRPITSLAAVPWRGVAEFYDRGVAQLTSGLVAVVAVTGVIAALLSSGLVYLEVLARRRDLDTMRTLGGTRLVRRLVVARAGVLVAAGAVVGTAMALLALRAAEAGIGAPFSIPVWVLVLTWAAVGAGAFAAGAVAGLRALSKAPAGHGGSGSIPVRRFPGPVRFLLVTPRVSTAVFSAVLVTGVIMAVVLHTASVPGALFEPASAGDRYYTEGLGNPLRTSADRFFGENVALLDEVERAMPITFAPTVVHERPVMVKGTDFGLWRGFSQPDLVRGEWPNEQGQATVGVRAARAIDASIGDVFVVPASYHWGLEYVTVVGIHETGGLEDDELFTDLGTAGRLAGLDRDRISGIYVRLADPDVEAVPTPGGLEVSRLRLEPADPVPLAPATAIVAAANFAPSPQTRDLELRANGVVLNATRVRLGAHETTEVRLSFIVPPGNVLRVQVNPEREWNTGQQTLDIGAPSFARPGRPTVFNVTDSSERPVEGAAVQIDGVDAGRTDDRGRVSLTFPSPRLAAVTATSGDEHGGVRVRVALPEWEDDFELRAERLLVRPARALNDTHFEVPVEATVVNLGGLDFVGKENWTLGGVVDHASSFGVGSGSRVSVTSTVSAPFGTRTIGFLGRTQEITVAPSGAAPPPTDASVGDVERPRTIEDVLAEKREQAARAASASDPTQSFLDQVFSALEQVTVLVVLVTMLHGGALVWVATVREVRERSGIVATMRDLGASEQQVQSRAVRDAFLATAPAAVLGVVAALAALLIGREIGFPSAFGHALPPAGSLSILVRTAAVLVAIALAASVYAVRGARRQRSAVALRRPVAALMGDR